MERRVWIGRIRIQMSVMMLKVDVAMYVSSCFDALGHQRGFEKGEMYSRIKPWC
jgi:hypothetical protein